MPISAGMRITMTGRIHTRTTSELTLTSRTSPSSTVIGPLRHLVLVVMLVLVLVLRQSPIPLGGPRIVVFRIDRHPMLPGLVEVAHGLVHPSRSLGQRLVLMVER